MNSPAVDDIFQTTALSQRDFFESIWADAARLKRDAQDTRPRRSLSLDVVVYLVIGGLVALVWRISKMGLFKAGDDTGYWIGVAGGVMMLLLFTYPLRKYFRFTRNWGRMKWWFAVHMVLGIGGPLLILLHSNFHVGSLNAGVALYSMLAVAISGVIGRFLFARVNQGLQSEQASLQELQMMAGMQQEDARSRLHFVPDVEARLLAFEQREINATVGWPTYLRQVFWLPLRQWYTYRQCVNDLRHCLENFADRENWSRQDLLQMKQGTGKLVNLYLTAVTRVAQFRAYQRLFSLWHMAHVPFVYMLIVSALVHVAAVHAY